MATPCIVLQQKGTIRQTVVGSLEIADIAKALKRIQHPTRIGEWRSEETRYVIYGYPKGKTGTESTHALLPPFDETVLFGDILILAHTVDGVLHPFTVDLWKIFLEEEKSDSESDSEADSEEESEEEEVVEEKEEEEVDAVIAADGVPEEEEEEAAAPRVRAVSRSKKPNRRLPPFFALSEMESDRSADAEHPLRDRIRSIISLKLTMLPAADQLELEKGILGSTIETCRIQHCWRRWENPEFQAHYQVIARRTLTNLDPVSYVKNAGLIAAVLSKSIPILEVPYLPMTELFPDMWKAMMEQQVKQEIRALEGDKDMSSNMFKCKGCGKSQTTYYELQTRSADEPMTIFIRCIPCGKQWRQ